jgi:uncharacterized oligopeptide transporter (OPT) family protein
VHESDSAHWGYFRRPVLLGPAVGFLAFLGSEAVSTPAYGTPDGLIWLPLFLIVATILAAIPYLIGTLVLLGVFRVLPYGLARLMAPRVLIGAVVGAFIAWPFGAALNWIPSATADPRFNITSMLAGGLVAGAFCAAFYADTKLAAPPDTSLERTHEG